MSTENFRPIDDAAKDGRVQLVRNGHDYAAAYWTGDMWAYSPAGFSEAAIERVDFEPTEYNLIDDEPEDDGSFVWTPDLKREDWPEWTRAPDVRIAEYYPAIGQPPQHLLVHGAAGPTRAAPGDTISREEDGLPLVTRRA